MIFGARIIGTRTDGQKIKDRKTKESLILYLFILDQLIILNQNIT